MKYLFGPIPSRRLGISLGVDLVPHKVCSFNCIYCEVGPTTNLTITRKEYVPISEVIQELDMYLSKNPKLDFITFSGQGEPTLNSGLGMAINYIKENFPRYKVAILTNGTLFFNKEVREKVLLADIILPSLDAVSENVFHKLNRPHKDLSNVQIVEGLIQLRQEFKGQIHLELFLVPGLNDTKKELQNLKQTITKINPDILQLNTLDRPGTENWIKPLSQKKMEDICEFMKPIRAEIIANPQTRKQILSFNQDISKQIVQTIRRRPCTDKDLCDILGLHINELNKYLSELIAEGQIQTQKLDRGIFFKPTEQRNPGISQK